MSSSSSLSPSSLGLTSFPSYRPGQEDLIWSLSSSLNRFTALNAPTGTGKSLISISAAKVLGGRCLYLVVTKNLGRQLMNDFEPSGLFNINGHVNYSCASRLSIDDGNNDSDDNDIEIECNWGDNCLYSIACNKSLSHDLITTNYAHWITLAKADQPNRLGQFDTLILDEAHNILPRLTDYLSLKFNARSISRYLGCSFPSSSLDLNQWIEWGRELIPIARQHYKSLVDSKADKKDIRRVLKIGMDLRRLITDYQSADLIVKQDDRDKRYNRVHFVPMNISQYMEKYLFRNIPRVILVSGTLFKDDLPPIGIIDNFDYKEITSPFSSSRRPIYYFPSSPPVKVTYKMSKGERIVWMQHNDRIANYELSLGNKGIVQTRSYDRSLDMVSSSKIPQHQIIYHNRDNGASLEAIKEFKSVNDPCVLFSPVIEEGVDFPDDQCRFQIIPKIPFLNRHDVVIKARMARDKLYDERETARTLIQQCGRIVRGPNDYGRTYITDSQWEWFRKKKYFYRWFRMGFKAVNALGDIEMMK